MNANLPVLFEAQVRAAPELNLESKFMAGMAFKRGGKMAIGLQYWDGDYLAAMEVVKLIADLQPKRYEVDPNWIFILMGRRDAKNPPKDLVEYLRTKFKTWVLMGERREVGHPGGSNSLIHDLFSAAYRLKQDGVTTLDGILTMEADCCPLSPDWLDRLREEWYGAQPCGVLGHYQVQEESGHEHVNGSFLADPELFHKLKLRGCGTTEPWDLKYFGAYKALCRASNQIFLMYKHPTTTTEELFGPHYRPWSAEPIYPCYIHGIRDNSARRLVRERFL